MNDERVKRRTLIPRTPRHPIEEKTKMSQKGILRPGHVCIRVMDLNQAVKHYTDHLGLIETDRDDQGRVYLKGWDEYDWFSVVLRETQEAGMDFMACSNKAHDVAIIRRPEPGKLHHVSFLLDSWEEVLRAGDIISKYDLALDIGPTRHGITRARPFTSSIHPATVTKSSPAAAHGTPTTRRSPGTRRSWARRFSTSTAS
jgi:catechol 2,3-dioxygenase-like lactoylglutathione lyase family enzyme